MAQQQPRRYRSFKEFYPFYREEHAQTGTRVLHFIGTSLFLAQVVGAIGTRNPRLLLTGIVSAYSCAWLGHFFIEKNRPATFKYPLMSLMGDFKMYVNILTGREGLTRPAP